MVEPEEQPVKQPVNQTNGRSTGRSDPSPPLKIEPNSPFFLGPQDRPGDFITPTRLRGDNYDDWAGDIQTALEARRKFVFLDGTITTYSPPCTELDWTTINAMIISWLMNTMDPEVKTSLSKYRDAKRLWDTLKSRFGLVNGPRIQQLKAAISKCEQTKTMSVSTYFGKLTALWEELHRHEPLINCDCCTRCTAGSQHELRRETSKLHQFLMGLYSEYYAQTRTNILSKDPFPSLDTAYQLVSQDERVRLAKSVHENPPEVVGFSLRSGGQGRGTPVSCSHCKKTGHEISQCFEIIGYPEWWGEGGKPVNGRGRGIAPSQGAGRGRNGSVRANATTSSGYVRSDVRVDVPTTATATVGTTRFSVGAAMTGADSNGAAPSQLSSEQLKALAGLAGLLGNTKLSDDRLNGMFDNSVWIIDTGASNHVTGCMARLCHISDIPGCPVGLPNGDSVIATKKGSVVLTNKITLKNVLFVPNLSCNLISVSQLNDDMQCIVQFNSHVCAIQDQSRELIGTGVRRDGLYYFNGANIMHQILVNGASSTLDLWHKRMGHSSEEIVKLLPSINDSKCSLNKACEVCFRAKQHRDKFPLSDNRATRIFEKVHCDLWGSYRHASSCGARYFFTIVDDYSRAVWVYLLIDKTEVFQAFMTFVAIVQRQFDQKIKVVQSDNGTELRCLLDFFSASGIFFQTSCIGTPQQNGRFERKHQHILNVARALRFQANLPIYFWGEAILASAYLINRTPSSLLHNKTPHEILFGNPPSYNTIRVFGSLCFAHNQKVGGDKFASRSRKCMCVGYPYGKKGWKLFDLDTKDFFVSRDVKFFEDIFPFKEPETVNIVPEQIADLNGEIDLNFDDYEVSEILVPASPVVQQNEQTTASTTASSSAASSSQRTEINGNLDTTLGNQPTELELGRGMREKIPSSRLRDYVVHSIEAKSPSLVSPSPQLSSGTPYPIAHYMNCDNFSVTHRNFLAALTLGREPKSFREAMTDEGWKNSMHEEIKALEDNGTWTLEPLPPGKRVLGNQWVYRIKYRSDGSVERLKSRLVVFGNHQKEGVDYAETFAPVAKMVTVRDFYIFSFLFIRYLYNSHAREFGKIVQRRCVDPVDFYVSWKKVPYSIKEQWFDAFLVR